MVNLHIPKNLVHTVQTLSLVLLSKTLAAALHLQAVILQAVLIWLKNVVTDLQHLVQAVKSVALWKLCAVCTLVFILHLW